MCAQAEPQSNGVKVPAAADFEFSHSFFSLIRMEKFGI